MVANFAEEDRQKHLKRSQKPEDRRAMPWREYNRQKEQFDGISEEIAKSTDRAFQLRAGQSPHGFHEETDRSDSLAEIHSDIHRRKLQARPSSDRKQENLTGESGPSSEQIQAKTERKNSTGEQAGAGRRRERQNWSERWRHLQKNEMHFQETSRYTDRTARIRNTSSDIGNTRNENPASGHL